MNYVLRIFRQGADRDVRWTDLQASSLKEMIAAAQARMKEEDCAIVVVEGWTTRGRPRKGYPRVADCQAELEAAGVRQAGTEGRLSVFDDFFRQITVLERLAALGSVRMVYLILSKPVPRLTIYLRRL